LAVRLRRDPLWNFQRSPDLLTILQGEKQPNRKGEREVKKERGRGRKGQGVRDGRGGKDEWREGKEGKSGKVKGPQDGGLDPPMNAFVCQTHIYTRQGTATFQN